MIPVSKYGGYPIKLVSTGEEHVGVINEKGELWTWGLNSSGQCGVPPVTSKDNEFCLPTMPFTAKEFECC